MFFDALREKVTSWRAANYSHTTYPVIAEILDWAREPDGAGFRLRPPQIRALETYWYLRLLEQTPNIPDLYARLFPRVAERLTALGVPKAAFEAVDFDFEVLTTRIRKDDAFVQEHRLQALRETLTLAYPSYILALAMGAGKTALIGAIVATEFAMAMEYPDGPFVQNALVFAPGTTIIETLRELAEIPYDRILPPRCFKAFAASVKLTFTRDGEKGIPVIGGSIFNVVVTNTEKIRIQKETIRKAELGGLKLAPEKEAAARAEVANLRLQTIASLPHRADARRSPSHVRTGAGLGVEKGPKDRGLPPHGKPQSCLRRQHHRHTLLPAATAARCGSLVRPLRRHPRWHSQGGCGQYLRLRF